MQRLLQSRISISDPSDGVVPVSNVYVASAEVEPYVAAGYVADGYVGNPLTGLEMHSSITVDIDALEAARPRTLPAGRYHLEQVYGWQLTIGGTVFGPQDIIPPLRFREELGGGQSLEVSFPVGDDLYRCLGYTQAAGPQFLGSFFGTMGAPIKTQAVQFDWIYVTSSGFKTIRLMTNGVLSDASLEAGDDGRFVRLSISDARARWDRRVIDYSLPVGHLRTRERIAREMLIKAGVPAASIALSGSATRLRRAIQVSGSEAWSEVASLFELEGRHLDVDRLGRVISPKRVRTSSDGSPSIALREVDLRVDAGGLSVSGVIDAPTRITLTATRQREADEVVCGLRTVDRVTETFGPYAVREAVGEQDSLGAISSHTPNTTETDQLIERIINRQVYDCDDLVLEEILEYRWHNLETWRYEREETDDTIAAYQAQVFFFAAAAMDDAQPAYKWRADRFGLEHRTVRQKIYGDVYLEQEVELQYGSVRLVTPVKERSVTSATWESQNWRNNQKVFGNRDGAYTFGEELAGINGTGGGPGSVAVPGAPAGGAKIQQAKVTDYEISDEGYILSATRTTYAWRIEPGSHYLYNGETTSDVSALSWKVVEVERVAYVERGDGLAREVVSKTVEGQRQPTVSRDIDGYLPEAERKTIRTPSTADATADEVTAALEAASPFDAELMRCHVASPLLEATRVRQDVVESVDGLETEGELCSLAMTMLLEGSALEVSVQPAAINTLPKPGDLLYLRYSAIGLDHVAHYVVNSIDDDAPAWAAADQKMEARIYAE